MHIVQPKKPTSQPALVMDPPRDIDAAKVIDAIREAVHDHWLELNNPDQQKYRNAVASLRAARVVEVDPAFILLGLPPSGSEEAVELTETIAAALYAANPAFKDKPWNVAVMVPGNPYVVMARQLAAIAIVTMVRWFRKDTSRLMGPDGQPAKG